MNEGSFMNRIIVVAKRATFLSIFAGCVLCGSTANAQSGLRESLDRLDRNADGNLDPDEITPLARPFLERIGAARRLSLSRSNSIERWQEAARVYHALQNGVSGKDIRPEGESTVKAFGPDPDDPLVPEFGLAVVKFPYVQDDLDEADRTLRRSDRNRDGYIDRTEAMRAEWTHRNPFQEDFNKDDRLSRMELAQRYARRRLVSDDSDELIKKAQRTGNGIRETESRDSGRRDDSQYRRGGSRYYLTASVLSRFDSNKNGSLDAQEAIPLGIPVGRVDTDRDGELSRQELYSFLGDLQDEVGGLSDALPSWFYELDVNRDRQVAMSEFTEDWSQEKLDEFAMLDANGDGLLTAPEILQSNSVVGGSYRNDEAVVLPPKKTVISEIDVEEDFIVGDLNVQLSITHTYASHLDAYLTGPDGQRIELFTEIGGSDDHFDQTIFDDQSRYPVTKARPPFKGTFMTEALAKKQPSLSHFNGKSIKGVWQLVIRCSRSDRFGMLHNWSLIVKPQDDMMESVAAAPAQDGPQQTSSSSPLASRYRLSKPERGGESQPEVRIQLSGKQIKWGGKSEVNPQAEKEKMEARRQAFERYREIMEKRVKSGELSKQEQEKFRQKLDGAKSYFKR